MPRQVDRGGGRVVGDDGRVDINAWRRALDAPPQRRQSRPSARERAPDEGAHAALHGPDVVVTRDGRMWHARGGRTIQPTPAERGGYGGDAGSSLQGAAGAAPRTATGVTAQAPVPTAKRRAFIAAAQGAGLASGMRGAIRGLRNRAKVAAFASTTHGLQQSAMRYFIEYAEVEGIDWRTFTSIDGGGHPTPERLAAEDEILADFACYVVLFPRVTTKQFNLGNTAFGYVSHVRTWYELNSTPPRRPGSSHVWGKNDHLGSELRRCLDGLRKLHPSTGAAKVPILRRHMVKLAQRLRGGTKWERTRWAVYCAAWQGGRRIGELVRGKKRTGAWQPALDMHRGRLERLEGKGGLAKYLLHLAPNKTDVTGEQGFVVQLPLSETAELNAAQAIVEMLAVDPTGAGGAEQTPLFRDWREGRDGGPIAYETLRRALEDDLRAVGEADLAAAPHSFRRGCATMLAGIGAPDSITRMIGVWASNANLGYTWASHGIVGSKMLEAAEWDDDVDIARGPIAPRR